MTPRLYTMPLSITCGKFCATPCHNPQVTEFVRPFVVVENRTRTWTRGKCRFGRGETRRNLCNCSLFA
ncbi:hypothetical protein ACLKA6_000544 [Drosophila palustris]